jgi:hypothetical protein
VEKMTINIQIDKGVPIPTRPGGLVTKYAPTIRALEIGDSFWIAKDTVGTGFRAAARRLAKDIKIKLAVRSIAENGTDGWRVWRIE